MMNQGNLVKGVTETALYIAFLVSKSDRDIQIMSDTCKPRQNKLTFIMGNSSGLTLAANSPVEGNPYINEQSF